jgi:hypothetical protein
VKGFDVWKLLGGKAPRGYKRGVLGGKAGLKAVKEGGKAKAPQSMSDSVSPQDLLTLLGVAGTPLATYGIGRHLTKKKREEEDDE